MKELAKTYSAHEHEDAIYHAWEQSGYFNPDNLSHAKEPFTIAIPPPNATGTLHMGHAMFLTLQDLMTRFQRMRGKKALWLPGTDHASIATQNKVEKLLVKEGKTRHDMSREDFIKRIDAYVAESRSTIRNQIRKMGSSCDWSRERYTLDAGLSHAVTTMFVRMYSDGLIYRGNRIVNWCTRCKSTLADDEVKYKQEKTPFYYFKYGPVIIGTARPETKFLDKTIVVHPEDDRYKELVGNEFDVEWIEGPIRAHAIADTAADKDFGTGAMTITPGHSFEDFELARKYDLPVEKIIDENGNLTKHAGSFALRNARDSRADIVKKLQEKNLVDHIDENYEHNLSICYRCDTPIEPLPSLQWFIAVNKKIEMRGKSLKELASEAVSSKRITMLPKRFDKVYFTWMNNLRDWCISRQIVFGHRLPVYYCEKKSGGCGDLTVAAEAPTECHKCKHTDLRHDEDTLDTWFSSALWTFSTLGWPENVVEKNGKIKKKGDLATFHPTTVMETGYDLIFFWVARMIIMSEYALHEEPFKIVYFHGLVLDANRKKMSKSREETQIDPLDMIPEYGADAIRMSMLVGVTPGNDLFLSKEKIAGYRNFVNKLWNISRFILQFSGEVEAGQSRSLRLGRDDKMTLADRWIFSRLATTLSRVTQHIEKFQFSHAAEELRQFTWDEVADWYLEIAKIEKGKRAHLLKLLEHLLALWHPFTPFVTEVVYQHMRKTIRSHFASLMIHPWPKPDKKALNKREEQEFALLQELIRQVRNARQEHTIPPTQNIQMWFWTNSRQSLVGDNAEIIKHFCRIDMLTSLEHGQKPENAVFLKIADDLEVYLPLGMKPRQDERAFIEKKLALLNARVQDINTRLTDTEFLARAPEHIINAESAKRTEYITKMERIEEQLKKFLALK